MDVAKQVDNIVDDLVKNIETRLNNRVDQLVEQALQARLDAIDYEKKLNWLASAKLDNLISDMDVDMKSVQARIDAVGDTVVNGIASEGQRLATDYIKNKLYTEMDLNHVVREVVATEISKKLSTFEFPRGSIPGEAINAKGLQLTGNNIQGGIVKNFSSNGIEDKSSQVQMTLLDTAVVIENKIVSLGLEVKGQTVIEGDLHILGDVPMDGPFFKRIIDNTVQATKLSLNTELFEGFSSTLFDRIRTQGIDLDKLVINGQNLVDGNKLNYGISDTNITRVGIVKDLQTQGESYLSGTLYVGKDRVGINTMEPGHALSVWDQEVEVAVTKRQRDVAWVGMPREQSMILGANNKDNITLNQDGSVSVARLFVNHTEFGTCDGTPNFESAKGSVMFNNNPIPGGPAGWVCLGGAAWSRFGTLG